MAKKKKIPTKSELIQLQRLYKTDEKIGERLGGVPAYLVAYWRRKKNVAKHSQPKFSDKEIMNLWERFGDDDKCGLELGISKAAFYNWRRKYNIKEKPAFLKLEQLEFNFPGLKLNSGAISLYNKQTIIQKTIATQIDTETVEAGKEYTIEPDMVLSNGNSNQILCMFTDSKTDLVWNPNKISISLTQSNSNKNVSDSERDKHIREFVKRQGIKGFFESTDGCSHQVALESGKILPGQFIFGADSYTLSHGAISAYAQTISEESVASIWSTGKMTIKVPQTVRIEINGRRSRGVYGKDIALLLLKKLQDENLAGKSIEFYGNVISQMSISERFTLCNLSQKLGVVSAICPFDSVTRRYLTGRTLEHYNPIIADKNAEYENQFQFQIDSLKPLAANCQDGTISNLTELENIPVHLIIIGTSNNGRFEDLRTAAEVLKGRKVSHDCRLMVYPGSRSVYLEALKKGLIRVLVESGATILFPGSHNALDCGCQLLASGERALVTSNFNLFGSLDSEKSAVYISSPATAAASAINGKLTDPSRYVK